MCIFRTTFVLWLGGLGLCFNIDIHVDIDIALDYGDDIIIILHTSKELNYMTRS